MSERIRSCAAVLALYGSLAGSVATDAAAQATTAADTGWTVDRPLTGRAIRCDHGRIKIFDCQNVELLSYLPQSVIGGAGEHDIWGWTDSTTHREFIIAGGPNGVAFVDVTDPVNPKYLGRLPFHNNVEGMAGVKVYKHHALVVAESAIEGLQVFDLAQLREVRNPPVTFQETAHYDGIDKTHTITMNEASGFAYLNGTNGWDGLPVGRQVCSGLHIVDVRTPEKPIFAGCYNDTTWVHDSQCVIYHGPDKQYRGREICLNSVTFPLPKAGVLIVDVTDKQHPKSIGFTTYPNAGIVHQGWLTEDQRYFFLDDEARPTDKTRTIVFDLSALDDPVVLEQFYSATTDATGHNLYIRGKYMYQSNYTAGLRILDIHDPKHPKEVGFLDTDPEHTGPGQILGTWGNYPYLKNNVVAVASKGLFLVRLRP